MAKAGVAERLRASRIKPEIALHEIDRLISANIRFVTVLADTAMVRQPLRPLKKVSAVASCVVLTVYGRDRDY
ncbi:hypothetical protein ATN84_20060 [Paramesorhizobium deserti]|uniref:Uncharacterized protein n=1 Tax=Paramesorhizobium deserti TaxID=1494590 RepID=A0A135HQS7_9HYPH|nr:hypothetical protein ATN84_20060 [Paramesorhizobium deserti]